MRSDDSRCVMGVCVCGLAYDRVCVLVVSGSSKWAVRVRVRSSYRRMIRQN